MPRRAESYLEFVKGSSGYYSNYPIYAPVIDTGGQVYNVKSFGAKGNGISDDTTALKVAYAAATIAGGIMALPPGTYLVSSTITLAPNTTIQGSGVGNTVITCPSGMSTPIFNIVMTTTSYLHNFYMKDLTMDGASGAATRGVMLDSSASNQILYYHNIISNVCFQNFYIGVYHGANNASAGAMINYTGVSWCRFVGNVFGYIVCGTYGEWLDHIYFSNNTKCALMTLNAFSAPSVSGSAPGSGPTTICKVTNIDVENTIANYSTGTDNGILMSASHSSYANIFVSACSQIGFECNSSEPGLDCDITDLRIYGCGGGAILSSNDASTGGVLSSFSLEACGQKSNFSGGYPGRQAPIDLASGSWKLANGKIINGSSVSPSSIPPYTIALGDSSSNNMDTVVFSNVTFQDSYATALTNLYSTQNNLQLVFRDCPGFNPAGSVTVTPSSHAWTNTANVDVDVYVASAGSYTGTTTITPSGGSAATVPNAVAGALYRVPAYATLTWGVGGTVSSDPTFDGFGN